MLLEFLSNLQLAVPKGITKSDYNVTGDTFGLKLVETLTQSPRIQYLTVNESKRLKILEDQCREKRFGYRFKKQLTFS